MPYVIIVRKDKLRKAPEAFQQYVEDFFVEKKVLGIICLVAECHCYCPNNGHFTKGSGLAPSHSVELRQYRQGLPKDCQSLNSWIWNYKGPLLYRIVVTEDRTPWIYAD